MLNIWNVTFEKTFHWATILVAATLSLSAHSATKEMFGPFPIKRVNINQLPFVHVVKTEQDVVDPVTGETTKQPVVTETPSIQDGPSTSVRTLYLGPVPRFELKDLEMVVSKVALTLRVKAWIRPELIRDYEGQMIRRWYLAYSSFQSPKLRFERLSDLNQLAAGSSSGSAKRWLQIAGQYSKHFLEDAGVSIYDTVTDDNTYRDQILLASLRKLMHQPTWTLADGVALYNAYNLDPAYSEKRVQESADLFDAHFGDRLVLTGERVDNIGFITIVYPIASDAAGPFQQPSEGVRKFPLSDTIEARWWSNMWLDEFGGFPFLLITSGGVAFHGPITMGVKDTWFLRRDYVSHSCMRMDAADVKELRQMMPLDLRAQVKAGAGVPLRIQSWPDVSDTRGDGTLEVTDVGYYPLPSSSSAATSVEAFAVETARKKFWTKRVSKLETGKSGTLDMNARLKRLLPAAAPMSIEVLPAAVDGGRPEYVLKNIPQYTNTDKGQTVTGQYESVKVRTFPIRPTAIIQYYEDGIVYDEAYMNRYGMDDRGGNYSYKTFLKY